MIAVLAVAVPWFYVRVIVGPQPAALTLPPATAPAPTAAGSVATGSVAPGDGASPSSVPTTLNGNWVVGLGSRAGYRVKETIVGQTTEVVGRTDRVTGTATVTGSVLTAASFSVEVGTIASDDGARDTNINDNFLQTGAFPTATFELTQPIQLPDEALTGDTFSAKAKGTLTMHGRSNPVSFPVTGRRSDKGFDVTAQIPVKYGDYDIGDPSVIDVVKVAKNGIVEVLLSFTSPQ